MRQCWSYSPVLALGKVPCLLSLAHARVPCWPHARVPYMTLSACAPSPMPHQRPYHPCAHIMPTNTYLTQAQLQVYVHTLAYMPTPKARPLATKPLLVNLYEKSRHPKSLEANPLSPPYPLPPHVTRKRASFTKCLPHPIVLITASNARA